MIRKLLKACIPYPSVRSDLNVAGAALRNAAYTVVNEFRGDWRRLRDLRDIKLHVGCGELIREGWVNIDCAPGPGAIYVNVVNRFPFADGAAQHIHCEHFLEHLEYPHAKAFLRDCHRTLKAGGGLRIILPDAEKYLAAYGRQDYAYFSRLERVGNASEPLDMPMLVINQVFRMGGHHRFAWDFQTLRSALEEAGFSRVERSRAGDVAEEFRIDGADWWRAVESLYVNAWK